MVRAILLALALRAVAVRVELERESLSQGEEGAAEAGDAHLADTLRKEDLLTFPGRGADVSTADEPWEGPLQVAEPGSRQPLITALDPPPGKTYRFSCAELFNILDANQYDWVLDSVEEGGHRTTVNRTVAELRGSWTSGMFGHRRTRVTEAQAGGALFDIRNANSAWNTVIAHWTWRIVMPEEMGSIYLGGAGEVFFTVQQDLVGDGAVGGGEEWHIYRGHVSDDDKVYYCRARGEGYRYECFHSKRHVNRPPVAEFYERENIATNMQEMWRDTYEVVVHENEDAALLLAIATVLDMTKDWSASAVSDHEGAGPNDAPADEEAGGEAE